MCVRRAILVPESVKLNSLLNIGLRPNQLIYGYAETDDDNDDEVDRTHSSISTTRFFVHSIPYSHGMK